MNIKDRKVESVYRELRQSLMQLTGSSGEATAMTRLIFHALKGWDTTGIVIHAADEISDFTLNEFDRILKRLRLGEPLQYILGEASFFGMKLEVSPATLIPRQETEELVELIIDRFKGTRDLRTLDIGTGSGAIAIALSRNLEFPEITALEISKNALEIARKNATRLHAPIKFIEADIFTWDPPRDYFDIIVSNPPYVLMSEQADMERHVIDHEPSLALFVPDSDPLKYYRRIAEIGTEALRDNGSLFFEINPLCAEQMKELMRGMGYKDVELHSDISHRPRFLSAGYSR